MRGIASLVCTFCFLFWGFSPNAQCRFRVVVEIPDASESYVAMLKDTWASYLGHRRVPVRGKAKFEDVPAGDFSLRIHFASGAEIVKSLRVDDAHTTSKDKLALRLRAADAVITPESRQAMHTVSVDELAVSTKAQSLFNEAWQAMERSEWQQARRLLEESIAESPGFFDAHNNLGVVARRMQDFEGAEHHFRSAWMLKPDSFEANVNLSEVLSSLGKTTEAIAAAMRGQRIRPHDARANAQLGVQLFLVHRYEECVPYLAAAAKADPQSYYFPQISLAVALERLGRRDEAARQLEHWLQHHATSPDRPIVEAKHRELLSAVAREEAIAAQ